ncbi:hypothetical protein KHC23_11385 [Ancylobacter dichloromethanicus]|uniref:HPr kinase n=2 Tax=Ancylobacter dichloromethanicus TaxID=518825 RepID=A0A9W6J6Q5_9HYPH|nr:hypothetical protein [Ancylobacter dichloromethanicus]MBS7554253.1 hypothetical protein [Ancylobacter dichloromethanicus]GLK71377.1 HPr kinase [Ancylobacter dichloromethanicus]
MADGYLCGWRIRSAIPLPELMPWTVDERPADLTVEIGEVPERLPGGREASSFLQVDDDGACLLGVPEVGRFLVRPSGAITIRPLPEASPAEIRLFLLGSVLGFICHQHGLLPLHGSCVEMDGGAVAFCGHSGVGKSTLALNFARRGRRVLSDDVCVIESVDQVLVRPSFPRLKLWRDTIEDAALSTEGLERNRRGQEKYHYLVHEAGFREPLPLRAIFLLRAAGPGESTGIERLSDALDILTALTAQTFRPRLSQLLGKAAQLFQARARIASSVPVFTLARRPDSPPELWLNDIEATVRG